MTFERSRLYARIRPLTTIFHIANSIKRSTRPCQVTADDFAEGPRIGPGGTWPEPSSAKLGWQPEMSPFVARETISARHAAKPKELAWYYSDKSTIVLKHGDAEGPHALVQARKPKQIIATSTAMSEWADTAQ